MSALLSMLLLHKNPSPNASVRHSGHSGVPYFVANDTYTFEIKSAEIKRYFVHLLKHNEVCTYGLMLFSWPAHSPP